MGPKQYFTGVINGKAGNTTTPITIKMACFGPVHPGETGHPMAGQTLAVHQLFPPGAVSAGSNPTGTLFKGINSNAQTILGLLGARPVT